ncbi:histamine H3 receptor-like [Babylonia areolata]|uniref:histamine H3 receptor-like n=1 Tax=Babylonia areolata TaxID=304850 RepID=UPI003FD16EFC
MVVHYSNKDESRPAILPLPWSAIAMVCMSVAIVTAVGGNILVVLSYMRDRRLRTVHNLYLLHLAVCDLTIGSVSMPLYFIYTVQYWRWTLGEGLCKVFLVEDSIVCFMAAQIVALVAWDRLALLTLGSSYQESSGDVVETRKRAYIKLAICWVIGFLINSPGIILWDVLSGHSVIPVDECDVEYKDNFVYVMVTQFLSFLLPFASLAAITSLMVVVWEKRMKVRPTALYSVPKQPLPLLLRNVKRR